jgi:hypothetical protein
MKYNLPKNLILKNKIKKINKKIKLKNQKTKQYYNKYCIVGVVIVI